ncbi:MAG: hypothetical protein H6Q30_1600 [Bacteroidetes bacterium]|jgi:hypothetical protein|nr:hypothetical protein [Bacteroidota bacterium]
MSDIVRFGESVEGYSVPVLNEREIRAAAGLLFLVLVQALMLVLFKSNFLLIKYFVVFFLTDFIVRVFVNPRFSPTLIAGRLIVGNQVPEYVGAAPKKFAWTVGLVLALIMFIFLVVVNSYSPITGLICLICLVFLFFESAFGICLGCKFYPLFFKEKSQHCPGGTCNVNVKQDIQKTSWTQRFILIGFAVYIFLSVFFLNETFAKMPFDLFRIAESAQAR